MKSIALLFIFLSSYCNVFSQKADRKLQRKVEELVAGFNGDIGIYIKNLNNNKIVAVNADTVFPTASVVKVPILIGVMDKVNKGELGYHQELVFKDSLRYSDFDIQAAYRDSQKTEISKLVMLMMTMSDNTASLWLQHQAGTGTRINEILDSLGLKNTRVNSRTPGRESNRNQYGWGQTTPREMATILEKIYRGEVISKTASDEMLRVMNRNYFDKVALSQIPPYATVFAKWGAVNQVRNEVILVKGDKACYLLSIFTKNNKDQKWTSDNEAWMLTRKISKLLWEYFEPEDKWEPAPDAEKFY
jgi:beta-lactamase class A